MLHNHDQLVAYDTRGPAPKPVDMNDVLDEAQVRGSTTPLSQHPIGGPCVAPQGGEPCTPAAVTSRQPPILWLRCVQHWVLATQAPVQPSPTHPANHSHTCCVPVFPSLLL